MDSIPQDVLYEALERHTDPDERERVITTLYAIAGHHRDHAAKLTAMRKKGHQSASRELIGVADHIRAYAEQLSEFVANNPVGAPKPPAAAEPHPDAVPGLPGNTGACAAFRRATQDDTTLCAMPRGHEGDHAGDDTSGVQSFWPRRTGLDSGWTKDDEIARQGLDTEALAVLTGRVCGDVVIEHDGTAHNCQRPLGHDGTDHYDGRYRLWPRGVGTSRPVTVCDACNHDRHTCGGCGDPIGHYADDCGKGCTDDGSGLTIIDEPAPGTVPACGDQEIYPPGMAGDKCMLPKGHTGKHIGHTGARWEQVAPAATLGDIAEQAKASMIPGQRPNLYDVLAVPMEVTAEMTAGRGGVLDNRPPAAVMVAEMKEQVSASMNGLTGDEPIGTTVNVGGIEFVKHSNNPFGVHELEIVSNPLPQTAFTPENGYSVTPTLGNPFAPPVPAAPSMSGFTLSGSTEPQAPAVPVAPFLPPHLVPGAPRARYSVSSVQAMGDCALKFRLKYRDGIADTSVSWANVGGTAFHAVVRTIEDLHADGARPLWAVDAPVRVQEGEASTLWRRFFAEEIAKVEASSGIPSAQWRASAGGKEGYDWWLHSGEDMARKYVHHRRKFLAEGWTLLRQPNGATAQEIEFDVSVDGVMNKGFIDSAWINTTITTPTIRVVDWKSGSKPGDDFQLKTYGHALRALGALGDFKVEGAFYNARKADWQAAPLVLTPDDDAEVSYQFHTTQALDRAGLFIARPSSYCGGCPVRAACPIMASKRS